uniref:Uncharacterized protein n=1 Tax=Aegilops tauschii subsp. strangulata TaxID=200361 RepID=A0A453A3C0_AEGTS
FRHFPSARGLKTEASTLRCHIPHTPTASAAQHTAASSPLAAAARVLPPPSKTLIFPPNPIRPSSMPAASC